ncbi:MAG TPA: HK97-gp10 family putative phage morphogenesis protein [Candidatus Acidoferrales bacterium]|nr:HK97-gp10 family putative phage morphogenesis protein [Candidatus Acidoferrales bacterium]
MAFVTEFEVTGFDELQAKLNDLPLRASRRILRYGLLAAVEIWRREMEATARRGIHVFRVAGKPVDKVFGYVAGHIGVKAKVNSDLEGSASVGPVKKGFWSMFMEFGTHRMGAMPFIRQAFESRQADVLEEFKIEISAALDREGMKLS